jgi:SHS2 domain-containing protein
MRRGYEFFPHTADVGAVVRGATLPRLFENAALALFDLLGERRRVRPRRRLRVAVAGSSLEDLLVRWLSELLFLRESKGWLFSACAVERVDRARFTARALVRGEPFDPARHRALREVKAITYHGLRVVRGRAAWRTRIVFDV